MDYSPDDLNRRCFPEMAKLRDSTPKISGSTKSNSSCSGDAVAFRSIDSMGGFLPPSTKTASWPQHHSSGIPPHYHYAEENPAVSQPQQRETLTFDTNDGNVLLQPSDTEPARDHICQGIRSSNQNFCGRVSEEEFAIYRDLAELEELPNLYLPVDCVKSEKTGVVHNSGPIKMSHYCDSSSGFWSDILVVEKVIKEMRPEVSHSHTRSSSLRLPSNRTSIDTHSLSQESNGDSTLRFLDPSFTTEVTQRNMHPILANTPVNSPGVGFSVDATKYTHPDQVSSSTLTNKLKEAQFVTPANDLPTPILDGILPGSSKFSGISSSMDTQHEALLPSSDQAHMDAKNPELIMSKQLTLTDVRYYSGAIHLPKKDFTRHFPNFLQKDDVPMKFFDLDFKRHWAMNFTSESREGTKRPGRRYFLHYTSELRNAHIGLQEGNWLHIYKIGSKSDARYALRVSQLSPGDLNHALGV